MADQTKGKVITLICERAVDLNPHLGENGQLKEVPDIHVVKFPCSGMIQPLMLEAAFKAGAEGVIVCGCQIGDCYYREGNRMIRERILGERPPGLKKTVDRRRVIGLWLARPQAQRFISEAKEFVAMLGKLGPAEAPKPADKPAPAAQPDEGKEEAPKAEAPKEEPKEKAKEGSKKEQKDESKAEAQEDAKPEAKDQS